MVCEQRFHAYVGQLVVLFYYVLVFDLFRDNVDFCVCFAVQALKSSFGNS